ncbi:hypothetical protein [Dactylosporangium sp. NPDC051484]|uniref:hypothetical protein n=1 Tax=Dactylosporangium sp. NPDC051484 TaxID=3154942 RepID=UPI003450C3FA
MLATMPGTVCAADGSASAFAGLSGRQCVTTTASDPASGRSKVYGQMRHQHQAVTSEAGEYVSPGHAL